MVLRPSKMTAHLPAKVSVNLLVSRKIAVRCLRGRDCQKTSTIISRSLIIYRFASSPSNDYQSA